MIDSPSALADLCSRARQQTAVALDTEFVWERTYVPALGVVQIGLGGDDVHLVDTLALTGDDLSPLGDLLADPDTEVVLHDALQDLQILARATGRLPRNVFDTQRVAGFVGQTATASLQDLVAWACGVTLDKGATRSDWLRRPLSETQVHYAENDVRYSLDVRDRLLDEAEDRQRLDWIDEEMEIYEDSAHFEDADPMEAVSRVKSRGASKLDGQGRTILRYVAAWREREARRLDRTRRMVLP
ncbi:MAG: ribonuclease D, partial [Bacteroidota bacterium]